MGVSLRFMNGLKVGFEIIDGSILDKVEMYAGAQFGVSIELLCFSILLVKL